MKTSITRAPGKSPMRAGCLRTAGLALAIAGILTAAPLRAESHHGGQQHAQRHAPRQVVRHDYHRHGGDGYGDRDGYGYDGPPIVYGPGAAPGINLFLPL